MGPRQAASHLQPLDLHRLHGPVADLPQEFLLLQLLLQRLVRQFQLGVRQTDPREDRLLFQLCVPEHPPVSAVLLPYQFVASKFFLMASIPFSYSMYCLT